MIPPKVFISYSHDSAEHKEWVLNFATTLRQRGVDAVFDQWDLKPGDDLPHFMESNLTDADYAIMVCTRNYVAKANGGTGGVGYEKMIMTASSLASIESSKVIPIIREKGDPVVPTFLSTKLYIDFTIDEDNEYSLDHLLRHLLDAPLYEKPEIGTAPFKPMQDAQTHRKSDGVREAMKQVIRALNRSQDTHVKMRDVIIASKIPSRIILDKYLADAREQGLLQYGTSSIYVKITQEGREYAIQNDITDEI